MREYLVLVRRFLARLAAQRAILLWGLVLLLNVTLLVIQVGAAMGAARPTGKDLEAELRASWRDAGVLAEVVTFLLATWLGTTTLSGDLRQGTLFTVLARPVSRTRTYLAAWTAGAALLVAFRLTCAAILIVPASVATSAVSLDHLFAISAQTAGELVWLAALTALAAAFGPGWATVAGALLVAATYFERGTFVGAAARLVDGAGWLLPQVLLQAELVCDTLVGRSAEVAPMVEVLAYRLCWTALLLWLGAWAFSRRDLTPRT